MVAPGVAQVHIGLVTPDLAQRTDLQRETLLALLYYARTVLPIQT